ncbi:DUF3576 domain-containing protein [Rickettsiales bacterium LUAb2]
MLKLIKTLLFTVILLVSSINYASAASNYPSVNKYAWMSSLKTISFMPLVSADPFSGVIITDWYQISNNTRYKLDIYILDGILNSQTVKVHVFKQTKSNNSWQDANVATDVATKLENTILNQARELRYNNS